MGNIKKDFLSGVLYTSISKYVGIFVSLIITAVLARLLPPSDFGIIAVASIMINFVNLLTDFGLGPAIVQNDTLSKTDLRNLFSFTIITAIIASIIVFMSSNFVAKYYENTRLINVVRLLALNVIFVTINIIPNALLLKAKKFRLIAIRTLIMQILSGAIGIITAYMGMGIYALVIQSILSSFGILIFNYTQNPIKPVLSIQKVSLNKVLNFSLFQFLSQIFNYFTKDIDKLLIGKYSGLKELGYYEKSYRLMQLPVGNLSYVFTPVMQPVFREYQHDLNTMFHKYAVILCALSQIAFPLSTYLFFESYDLIYIIYGSQWTPAVSTFKWLSLGIGFNILLSSSGPMFLVSNNVKMSFFNCIIEFLISISCISIGILWGDLNQIAIMVSIGLVLRFIYIFSTLTIRVFRLKIKDFISQIYKGIISGFILFAVFYVINYFFVETFSLTRLILFSIILLCIITYSTYKSGLISKLFNK